MRTHCTDQRDLDGTAPEVLLGRLPWHPVGRSGRTFGTPSTPSGSGTLRSIPVDLRSSRASGSGVAPVRQRPFCVPPRGASGQRHLLRRASSRRSAWRGSASSLPVPVGAPLRESSPGGVFGTPPPAHPSRPTAFPFRVRLADTKQSRLGQGGARRYYLERVKPQDRQT
jgi:hypothetical protein